MLCARFMRPKTGAVHGRLYRRIEAGFDAMLAGYRRTLDVALRHRAIMLGVFCRRSPSPWSWPSRFPRTFSRSRTPGRFRGVPGGFALRDDAPAAGAWRNHPTDPDVQPIGSQTGSTDPASLDSDHGIYRGHRLRSIAALRRHANDAAEKRGHLHALQTGGSDVSWAQGGRHSLPRRRPVSGVDLSPPAMKSAGWGQKAMYN
jgi:hypothetical protein